MKESKCESCVKHLKELENLVSENYRLQKLVDFMNTELSDRVELIEETKSILSEIHLDEKRAKDIVYKLLATLVK